MTNIERYTQFENNKNSIWLDRFTWQGLDGRSPKNKVSIVNFQKDTQEFNKLSLVVDAKCFLNAINKLADKYKSWCNTRNVYTEEELESMRNFFIGAIGEYFFTFLIGNLKCLLIKNHKTGKLERYDFDNVCPRLKGEFDYGVDLTGMVQHNAKYYPCAIQVKFWNPMSDNSITNKIAQSAHSDAICNEFIETNGSKDIFVCWLGNTRNVSKYLVENEKLYKHIGFIDMSALDNSVNENMPNFWNLLYSELQNISVFKS